MFDNVAEDYRRVASKNHGLFKRAILTLTNYGFLAVSVYRFGRFANRVPIPIVSHLLKALYLIGKTLIEVLFGISIDVNSTIGPGFYIGHFGCIVIHGDLGRGCSVGQGVTIGSKGAGKSDGWPSIGDDVYIGAGAKVIGRIRVGNNVVIGANAVVVNDVADNMLAVGVPAQCRPKLAAEDAANPSDEASSERAHRGVQA
ncbi:MAG: serine O-acetyltransferase [Gammaproteobacteria bacterium]